MSDPEPHRPVVRPGVPAGRPSPARLPWVGRDELVARLVVGVRNGRGALIRGVSGIGRSRLMVELVRRLDVEGPGAVLVVAGAPDVGDPFAVFAGVVGTAVHRDILLERLRALRPAVVAVDDAHLLDPAAAGVLYDLALSAVPVVAALRDDRPVPDALREIWKSGAMDVVDLPGLDAAGTAMLAGHLLGTRSGGEIDAGLAWQLHHRADGNPLLLRELIAAGVQAGAIVRRRGRWALIAPLPDVPHLPDLLAIRVRDLPPPVRIVGEVVALAERLRVPLAMGVAGEDALDEAESSGVVVVDTAAGEVRLSHVLWRTALLADLPTLRRQRHLQLLIDLTARARPADGPASDLDRVLSARWSLALGTPSPIAERLAVAALAERSDPELAENLLRWAVADGAGPAGEIQLARLLVHRHRLDDALAVLDAVRPTADQPGPAVAVTLLTAYLMAMPGQDPQGALTVLDDAERRFGPSPEFAAMRATALWRAGRLAEGVALARVVLRDQAAAGAARAEAALTVASVAMSRGDAPDVDRSIAAARPLVHAAAGVLPEGPDALDLIQTLAPVDTTLDVRLALERAEAGWRRTLRLGDDGLRAQYALVAGWCRLHLGEVDDAIRLLGEAEVAEGQWCPVTLPWVRAMLVQALTVAGRSDSAATLAREVRARPWAPVYGPEITLAEAASLAGAGAWPAARATARAAAEAADLAGQPALAIAGWYAAMRYGDPRTGELVDRLRRLTGAGRVAQLRHAEAVRHRDPVALEDAAVQLWAAGLRWFALEAQARTVTLYRERHDPGSTAAAAERLRTLQSRCPGVRSPVVAAAAAGPALTAREAEIARRALDGATDQQIAVDLGLSVRTVETHLNRAYRKLGVRGRGELRAVLEGPFAAADAVLTGEAGAHPAGGDAVPGVSAERVTPQRV